MATTCKPFDPSLPIGWLIDYINCKVGIALTGTLKNLIDALSPLFLSLFGIYFLLLCFNYLKGGETIPIMDFIYKIIAWSLLIGIGFNYSTYNSMIMPLASNLGNELAVILTGNADMSSSYDAVFINFSSMIEKAIDSIASHGSWNPKDIGAQLVEIFMLSIKILLLLVGILPFVALAVSFVISANAGAQIVAALGPLFFGFALFPATRQYFSSWVNTLFSYALIPALIAIVAVLATGVTMTILGINASPNGQPVTLVDVWFYQVLIAAFANLVFMFLLKQVASIASSLSAGGLHAGLGNAGGYVGDKAKHGAKSLMRMWPGRGGNKGGSIESSGPKSRAKAG